MVSIGTGNRPARGRRARRRLGVVAFALVQALAVAAVPLADPPMPAPSDHGPHLAATEEPGCDPVHDHLRCLFCRVLSSAPIPHGTGATLALAPPALAPASRLALPGPRARPDPALFNARAPPRA